MTEEVKKTTESEWRLKGLRNMIKEVYMSALEQKASSDEKSERNEIVHHMNKFCGNISTSLQQAYGNVTLQIPEIPADLEPEAMINNHALMKELDSAVVSKPLNWHTCLKGAAGLVGSYEVHTSSIL
jgi:hypothetical protein